MGIIATNFVVQGTLGNMPIYTNNLSSSNFSNISIASDLRVTGDVYTSGRVDVGKTIFTTFRLSSNISFAEQGTPEVHAFNNTFVMDLTQSDISGMTGMTMAVPPNQIYNEETGQIVVPMSGMYSIQMQASFSNNTPDSVNGVYLYMQNNSHSNVRMVPATSTGPLVSTSHTGFMHGGDTLLPTFFSSDPDAFLLGDQGETLVSYSVIATTSV